MVPRLLQRILTNRLARQQPFDDEGKPYETCLTTFNRWMTQGFEMISLTTSKPVHGAQRCENKAGRLFHHPVRMRQRHHYV